MWAPAAKHRAQVVPAAGAMAMHRRKEKAKARKQKTAHDDAEKLTGGRWRSTPKRRPPSERWTAG
jgi:hypothetical protein